MFVKVSTTYMQFFSSTSHEMLHNKVSNGVLGQLRQVWTEVRLINLLPKVRCDHM